MISRLALPALLLSLCTLCAVQALPAGGHCVCPQPPMAANYFEDFDDLAEPHYVLSSNTFDTFRDCENCNICEFDNEIYFDNYDYFTRELCSTDHFESG